MKISTSKEYVNYVRENLDAKEKLDLDMLRSRLDFQFEFLNMKA